MASEELRRQYPETSNRMCNSVEARAFKQIWRRILNENKRCVVCGHFQVIGMYCSKQCSEFDSRMSKADARPKQIELFV